MTIFEVRIKKGNHGLEVEINLQPKEVEINLQPKTRHKTSNESTLLTLEYSRSFDSMCGLRSVGCDKDYFIPRGHFVAIPRGGEGGRTANK